MKMTTRLIMSYLLVIVIIVDGFSLLNIKKNADTLRDESISTVSQLSDTVMAQIDARLDNMDQVMTDIFVDGFYYDLWKRVISEHDQEAGEEVWEILNSTYSAKSDIRRIAVYNTQGEFYCTGVHDASGADVRERAAEISAKYADIFAQMNGRVFIGPSPDFWNSGVDTQVIVEICPIKDRVTSKIIGYLEVQQNVMYLNSICNVQWAGLPLSLIVVMEDTDDLFYSNFALTDENTADIRMIQKETDSYTKLIQTKNYILARASSNNFYCHTVAILERSRIRAYQSSVLNASILGMIAVTLLSALFCVASTRAITKPMYQLVDYVEAVNLDNLNVKMKVRTNSREIQTLVASFEKMKKRLQDMMLEKKKAEHYQTKALFNALQKEISPHFLYNTLGCISNLCESGETERASKACLSLTEILRYASSFEMVEVTLSEEIENLHCYMMLMKSRYQQRLQYEIEVQEETQNALMPRLTLQPLLENAIKYSLIVRETVLIRVTARLCKDEILITVRDNGCGISPERKEYISQKIAEFRMSNLSSEAEKTVQFGGMGLIGTLTRLYIFFGGQFRYEINDAPEDGGTEIVLHLNKI